MRHLLRPLLCVTLAAMLLAACSSDEKKPLEGERIPVMQFVQKDDTQERASADILLNDVQDQSDWTTVGGNVTHRPENLALDNHKLEKIWSTSIGQGSDDGVRLITAPVSDGTYVFVANTEGEVSAYALKDGKEIWQVEILADEDDATVSAGLALDGDRLYVADGISKLMALDTKTGKTLWSHDLGQSVRGAPTVYNGQIYLITLGDETLALDQENGQQIWRHEGVQEAAGLLGAPSPAAEGSVVMTAYSSGDIVALRAETGQEAWSDNLTGATDFQSRSVTQLAGFRGLPVIDQEVVIAGNASTRTVAVHIPSGERLWQKEFGLMGTPWVSGNTVFAVTSNSDLVAIIKQSGQAAWTIHLPKFADDDKEEPVFWNGPVLGNGRLFVAGSNEEMWEIDPQTGKHVDTINLPDSVMLPPVIAGKTLLVITDDGELVAYK